MAVGDFYEQRILVLTARKVVQGLKWVLCWKREVDALRKIVKTEVP